MKDELRYMIEENFWNEILDAEKQAESNHQCPNHCEKCHNRRDRGFDDDIAINDCELTGLECPDNMADCRLQKELNHEI